MSRAVDEAARQLAGEVEVLRAENQRLRAALDAPPYVDCICPGCPRKVPQAWVSGLCEPCAAEDCEHTDGAKAVAADRDGLLAALRPLLSDIEDAAETDARWEAVLDVITGMTRDDLEAAEVNRGQGDEGAQAQPPGAAVAPTGQAGGEQSGSAGPPAGPCCEGARRIEDIPGDDTTLVGWWCPEHGTAPCRKLVLDLMRDIVFGPAGRSLLSVPAGVTADELLAAGFPDVAARMGGEPPPARLNCQCIHAPEQHQDNRKKDGWGACLMYHCGCLGTHPRLNTTDRTG